MASPELKAAAQRMLGRKRLAKKYQQKQWVKQVKADAHVSPKAPTVKQYKGKYAGPDKYKGIIPEHLKDKYKGTYFGKEANKGSSNRAPAAVANRDNAFSSSLSGSASTKTPPGINSRTIGAPAANFTPKPKTIPSHSMGNAASLTSAVKGTPLTTSKNRFTK